METWPCTVRDPAVGSGLQHLQFLDHLPHARQILLVESLWDVDSCRLVSVGSGPVCSLLGLEDSVWAGCANQVTVIQESSLQTQVDHLVYL